jgi:type IV pilus assembly protein PilO
MNLEKTTVAEIKKPQRSFSLEKYVQQLQQVDFKNIGSWSIPVKVTLYVLIFIFVGFIAYFLVIRGVLEDISSAEAQQLNLLKEYQEKESKLRNLQSYQAQLQLMEAQFNQQLQQLPKETEIPDLVEDINTAGIDAGLDFKNIQLLPEVKQEVFIEQPIDITVTGNYHSMAGFVSAIALLPRIVTLHDFSLKTDQTKGKSVALPKIEMNIKAKTYRYMSEAEKQATADGEAKKNEKK